MAIRFRNKKFKILITNFLLFLLIVLNFQVLSNNTTSLNFQVESDLPKSLGLLNKLMLNNTNIVPNLNNELNQIFFRRNLGNINDNLTFFDLSLNFYSINFKNSSILIKITDNISNTFHIIKYTFDGANNVIPEGINPRNLSETYYFQHNIFVNNFENSELPYGKLYKNIDLIFYISQTGLKYNFIVHPGGDPNDICLNIFSDLNIVNQNNSIVFFSQNRR